MRRSLLLTPIVCALLASCNSTEDPIARDGGTDTGLDAGADASADAGADAGRDSGEDASADAAVDPDWVLLPDWSSDCPIARAVHPERVFAPRWLECGAGCRVLTGNSVDGAAVGTVTDAWLTARGVIYSVLTSDVPTGMRVMALVPSDGGAIAAWRTPNLPSGLAARCLVRELTVGGGRAAFAGILYDPRDSGRDEERIYVAPLDEIGTQDSSAIVLPSRFLMGTRAVGRLRVSDRLLVFQMSPDGQLTAWADDTYQNLNARPLNFAADNVFAVGNNVFWQSFGTQIHLRRATHPTDNEVLYMPAGTDVRDFDTDGTVAAFNQMDAAGNAELWTGDLVSSGTFTPHRVRAMELRYDGTVGGGWFAVSRNDVTPARLELFRLSDGARYEHVLTDGSRPFQRPLFVTDERLDVITSRGVLSIDPRLLSPSAVP